MTTLICVFKETKNQIQKVRQKSIRRTIICILQIMYYFYLNVNYGIVFDIELSKRRTFKRFEEIHDYIYANDGLSPQHWKIYENLVLFDENEKLQKQFSFFEVNGTK